MKQNISKIIKLMLLENGYESNIKELATAIKMNYSTVHGIVSGRRSMSLQFYNGVIENFKISATHKKILDSIFFTRRRQIDKVNKREDLARIIQSSFERNIITERERDSMIGCLIFGDNK